MENLLDKKEVAGMLRISIKTLDNYITKGIGPKPIYIGPTLVRFTRTEIESFIQKSMEEGK